MPLYLLFHTFRNDCRIFCFTSVSALAHFLLQYVFLFDGKISNSVLHILQVRFILVFFLGILYVLLGSIAIIIIKKIISTKLFQFFFYLLIFIIKNYINLKRKNHGRIINTRRNNVYGI